MLIPYTGILMLIAGGIILAYNLTRKKRTKANEAGIIIAAFLVEQGLPGTILILAVETGESLVIRRLLIFFLGSIAVFILISRSSKHRSKSINKRKYPLTCAVLNNDAEKAEYLLTHGKHPDSERSPHTPLEYAAASGNLYMSKLLLDHGADPNCGQEPPMASAVRHKRYEMIQLLTEHGGDINGLINDEPYLFAAVDELDPILTELLLKNGADPNRNNRAGCSPLYLIEAGLTYSQYSADEISRANSIKELLLRYGAKE